MRTTFVLLLAILATSPAAAEGSNAWTAAEVARAAAEHAPAARLLESERTASACGLDRDDPEACARAGLIQAIYGDLAEHQRNEAAADAMAAYWRAVAVRDQIQLLHQAEPLIDTLEALAEAAARLEIADGNLDQLDDQRLQIEDRLIEGRFSLLRIRHQIAALIGSSSEQAEAARLDEPLGGQRTPELDVERQIEIAFSHRSDLRALETLCRCMNGNSLPAARDLLGTFSPGLGVASAAVTAARGSRLLTLHAPRPSIGDLACRRAQCSELVAARREQVQAEVRDAVLQVEEAIARVDVARRRAELADAVAERARRATEIEQQPPGTSEQSQLVALERQAELIERQQRLAVALVELQRAQGTAASGATDLY